MCVQQVVAGVVRSHLSWIETFARGEHRAAVVRAADDVECAVRPDAGATPRSRTRHWREHLPISLAAHVEGFDGLLVAGAARIATAAVERGRASVGGERKAAPRLQHVTHTIPACRTA